MGHADLREEGTWGRLVRELASLAEEVDQQLGHVGEGLLGLRLLLTSLFGPDLVCY